MTLCASSASQATSPLGTSLYLHLSLVLANSCPGAFTSFMLARSWEETESATPPWPALLHSYHGCDELMFGLDHLTGLLHFPTFNDSIMSFHLSYTTLHPCPVQATCLLISLFVNSSCVLQIITPSSEEESLLVGLCSGNEMHPHVRHPKSPITPLRRVQVIYKGFTAFLGLP